MANVGRSIALCTSAAALLIVMQASTSKQAIAQQRAASANTNSQLIHSLWGADLYHAYCAACHGTSGRGDGPVAPALKSRPADLTLITKRPGGAYPAEYVSKIISGEDSPMAHGSREMPIWGPVFHQVEADQDWGDVRLRNLTKYLQSLQKK